MAKDKTPLYGAPDLMDRAVLNQRLTQLAFRYLAAGDRAESDRVLADLDRLTAGQPGDNYVIFERLCDYIAEHRSLYVAGPGFQETLAWLNE